MNSMDEVSELVEVTDALRAQFASADDAAKLAAAAAVTADLEALCASREADARGVIERLTRRVQEEKAAATPPPEAAAHDERLTSSRARAARARASADAARAAVESLERRRQMEAQRLLDSEAEAEASEALDAYEEPRMRAAFSLYASISGIAWQMSAPRGKVVGTSGGPLRSGRLSSSSSSTSSKGGSTGGGLRRFEFDEENTPRYDLVNSMWDMIGR